MCRSNEAASDVRRRFGVGSSVNDVGVLKDGKVTYLFSNFVLCLARKTNWIEAHVCKRVRPNMLENPGFLGFLKPR